MPVIETLKNKVSDFLNSNTCFCSRLYCIFQSIAEAQVLMLELLFMILLECVQVVQVLLTLPLDITQLVLMEHTNSHSLREV